MQIKQILFAEEIQNISQIKTQDPDLYNFLNGTAINAEFLRRFLNPQYRFSGRLHHNFLDWFFTMDHQDVRIKRMIAKYGSPEAVLEKVILYMETQKEKHPNTVFEWKSLNINISNLEEENRAAKLILQAALGAAEISPSDMDEPNIGYKFRNFLKAPLGMAQFMFSTGKADYGKNLKGYFLQMGKLKWEDQIDLFSNEVNQKVIDAAAVEFRSFIEQYRNNKVRLIHMLASCLVLVCLSKCCQLTPLL